MGKYRHSDRNRSNSVWFKTLDETGKVIRDYPQAACFAQIATKPSMAANGGYYSGYGMDRNTKTIHVYRNKSNMPYDVPEIKRWIADLNEMGFPCRFVGDEITSDEEKQKSFVKDTVKTSLRVAALKIIRHGNSAPVDPNKFYNFFVDLKDYKDKSHLFSTLSLIRMLSESYMDHVPERYFEMIDSDPSVDKFQALQTAHKQGSVSGGHAVTFEGNGTNISHSALMKRFEKTSADLWDGDLAINNSWRG